MEQRADTTEVQETTVEQAPLTADALSSFVGKWVAVRDTMVIAAADSLRELRENDEVRRGDAVYVVPERASYFN